MVWFCKARYHRNGLRLRRRHGFNGGYNPAETMHHEEETAYEELTVVNNSSTTPKQLTTIVEVHQQQETTLPKMVVDEDTIKEESVEVTKVGVVTRQMDKSTQ